MPCHSLPATEQSKITCCALAVAASSMLQLRPCEGMYAQGVSAYNTMYPSSQHNLHSYADNLLNSWWLLRTCQIHTEFVTCMSHTHPTIMPHKFLEPANCSALTNKQRTTQKLQQPDTNLLNYQVLSVQCTMHKPSCTMHTQPTHKRIQATCRSADLCTSTIATHKEVCSVVYR